MAGLTEQWNGLPKAVTVPVQWQSLVGARTRFCRMLSVYVLKGCPVKGPVSPIAGMHGSRNQEIGMRVVPLISPSDPLAKNLLPVP